MRWSSSWSLVNGRSMVNLLNGQSFDIEAGITILTFLDSPAVDDQSAIC